MTPLLQVRNIEIVYKRVIVGVEDVSLDVGDGRVVAVLGANGAGKTTTLRAISGFLGVDNARVRQGSILFEGVDVTNRPPHELARAGIILVPERDKVFPNLTVAENMIAGVPAKGGPVDRWRMEELVYGHFPRLAELRARTAGLLSGGERQMLAVGSAIVCGPKLLLVDELSLGLAPVVVEDIARRLADIQREIKLAVLIVEQSAAVALSMADYAYVLETGRVVLQGPAAELRGNRQVQDVYLGLGAGGERRSYRDAALKRRAGRAP